MKPPAYIAGSFSDRPRLRGIRDELAEMGIDVIARWLDAPEDGDLAEWAAVCLNDVDAAHTLILFADVPSTAGGYWTELGYAYGCGTPVIGVGPKTNLFCCFADYWYPAWPELRADLEKT